MSICIMMALPHLLTCSLDPGCPHTAGTQPGAASDLIPPYFLSGLGCTPRALYDWVSTHPIYPPSLPRPTWLSKDRMKSLRPPERRMDLITAIPTASPALSQAHAGAESASSVGGAQSRGQETTLLASSGPSGSPEQLKVEILGYGHLSFSPSP